jgi:hypothetical protein
MELQSINFPTRSRKEQLIDNDLYALNEYNKSNEPYIHPYKVYTALLSQSGGEEMSNFSWAYGGPEPELPNLEEGKVYVISENNSATDFTICGASSSEADTYFIANGIQPEWSKPDIDGIISISWNEIGNPEATVLENTVGDIKFIRGSSGLYAAVTSSYFGPNSYISIQNTQVEKADEFSLIASELYNNNTILISTKLFSLLPEISLENVDDKLYNTPIEIRVYPTIES